MRLLQCSEAAVDCLPIRSATNPMLQAVKDSEPLRKAYEEVQPEQVKLGLRMSQSRPLYEAFRAIREGDLWGTLSEAQKRVVEGELRDFVLGGVALEVGNIAFCYCCHARRWWSCCLLCQVGQGLCAGRDGIGHGETSPELCPEARGG